MEPTQVSGLTEVADDTLGATIAETAGRPARLELLRGEAIGRYVVLDVLGRGAMGVVYGAYDPDLDRKVALKLLHAADTSEASSSRLMREARAMARLNHPSVITVLDVGTVDGRVFIAMELVEGGTLGGWVGAEPRTISEILRVFVLAGEGLAAAHTAGLVHRDFKPDNVLVAADASVRVTDFGIARAADPNEPGRDRPEGVGVDPGLGETISAPLTKTGAVMGTPAYMAPEQFKGAATDARSDQYSFCVALYEALYGERPFPGDTMAALLFSATEGRIRPAPKGSAVPARTRKILVRGLDADHDRRWPTMEALLAELREDTAPRRRSGMVALGLGLAVAAGAWAATREAAPPPDPCAVAATSFDDTWNADLRGRVRAGLESVKTPYSAQTAASVDESLNRYASAWTQMRIDACESTHVRKEQSALLMDQRMGCLDRGKHEFAALTSLLLEADEELVRKALSAADDLSPVRRCGDLQALGERVPLPEDPAALEAIDAVDRELGELRALYLGARYQEAASRGATLVERARATGHAPLIARVLLSVGLTRRRVGDPQGAVDHMRGAVIAGSEAGDDTLVAQAFAHMTAYLAWSLDRADEGELAALAADAALERAPEKDAGAEYELAHGRGLLFSSRRDYPKAQDAFRDAVAHAEVGSGPDSVRVAHSLSALAEVSSILGDEEEAYAAGARAVEIVESRLGDKHPDMIMMLDGLAFVAQAARDVEAVKQHQARACEVARAIYEEPAKVQQVCDRGALAAAKTGFDWVALEEAARRSLLHLDERSAGKHTSNHILLGVDLARALRGQGRWDAALEAARRADDLSVELRGEKHAGTGATRKTIADVLAAAGRDREAEQLFRESIQLVDDALGPKHLRSVAMRSSLAVLLQRTGRNAEAKVLLELALGIVQDQWRADDPRRVNFAVPLGHALFELGEFDEARRVTTDATKLGAARGQAPSVLASLSLLHARAALADGDYEAAHAHAAEATKRYEGLGKLGEAGVERVRAWLRKMPEPDPRPIADPG